MIIHQDCYDKNYTVNFYIDNIEIIINFIPKDSFNKNKLYFDLVVYYMIDNTIIKYNDKIFHNEEALKMFFSKIIRYFAIFIAYTTIFYRLNK